MKAQITTHDSFAHLLINCRCHYMRCILSRSLVESDLKAQDWEAAFHDLNELIETYTFLFPGQQVILGFEWGRRWYQMSQVLQKLYEHDKMVYEKNNALNSMFSVFETCLGEDHTVVQHLKQRFPYQLEEDIR
jgi:hypothetical protein